ncbi:MAG: YihA family ribosome biogenesis GTP-binding protein [Synergistaceae bacterium]|nr:YihA family ribosome biogenesis GTP-binding protein [Synergistaceae bacterium]
MSGWNSELFCTAFNKQQLPPSDSPEIVFVGRSNVGKSSLINLLLGKKIAKVSSKPGKTRSINFYKISTKEGIAFNLVDIPGYGYAKRGFEERKSWWKLIDDYFNEDRNISYVVHLIDFRHGPLVNDYELIDWLDSMNMPRLVVFTKGDKISQGRKKGFYQEHMKKGIVSVLPPFITSSVKDKESALLREGIVDVLKEMQLLDFKEEREAAKRNLRQQKTVEKDIIN